MFWENSNPKDDGRPFLICQNQVYSYCDVFSRCDNIFSNLRPRSIVLIYCDRDIQTILAYVGALRNNVIPLLIDSMTAQTAVDQWLNVFQIDYIFGRKKDKFVGYSQLKKIGDRQIFCRDNHSGKLISSHLRLLIPTSGSTGHVKCVRISSKNLAEVSKSIVSYMELDRDRISISSLPFHYSFGLSTLNCCMQARSSIVLTDKSWLDREFWDLVEQQNVTDLSGVPFMFEILRRIKLSNRILRNLRCVNQAGGRLDPRLTEYFVKYFGAQDIKFLTMYGATEASPRMSYVPHNFAISKLGSVGIAIDIGKFTTDAFDQRSEGELIYEGPNVCLGYATDVDDLAKDDENMGVLKTGDIGKIDDDGFVTLIGRKKRFVKVFGVSVNLDSLENIVRADFSMSAVIGVDDKIKVLVNSDAVVEVEFKKKIMSKIRIPASCLSIVKVTELYLNSSGKIDYPRLQRYFLD